MMNLDEGTHTTLAEEDDELLTFEKLEEVWEGLRAFEVKIPFIFFSAFFVEDSLYGDVIDGIFERLFPAFDLSKHKGFFVSEKHRKVIMDLIDDNSLWGSNLIVAKMEDIRRD